jgi:CelD/BcsL family acetyltransferase involved in cellulose biosynthesis
MADPRISPSADPPRAGLVIDAVADPAVLAEDWRRLERDGVVSPFQSYDWVAAWIEAGALPAASRVLVIRGRRGAVTEFLLPVVVDRVGPLALARRLGGSHASYVLGAWRDLSAGIPPQAIRDGFAALARSEGIDAFALDAVPVAWNGVAVPLAAALPARPSLDDAHAVRLDPSFETLVAARNAGHKRKKLKSKEKMLRAAGDYRITTAATAEEVEATLAAFFAQKAAALAARGIDDPFAAAPVREVWRRLALASLGSDAPLLELTRLEAGGAIRAVIGASIRDDRLYALFASFADDELTRASPGETLFFRHIEAACGRGLAVYDMGVGSERYKASWCDERIALVDLRLATSTAGRAFLGLTGLVERSKAAIRRDRRLWPLVARTRAWLVGRGGATGV